MTTVAKRYELSDNGLRKRCISLEIPLPPSGYWAKLKAGKSVPAQPELPPYKAKSIQKEADGIYKKSGLDLELIDTSDMISEQLKELDGLDLFSPASKERFLAWCKNIEVPKRNVQYAPIITDYQAEVAYRKDRDEQYRFRDVFRYSSSYMYDRSKIKYRDNKAVLPISVAKKQTNRAFGIVNALIKSVGELDGTVSVRSGDKDNANIKIFGSLFSFQLTELMVKRRSLLSDLTFEYTHNKFRPMYEKVYCGLFEIEFAEILDNWYQEKIGKVLKYVDSIDNPIENQMGEMFICLCRVANEAVITDIVAKRKWKQVEIEQQRVHAIEEENKKRLQLIEEQNRRRKHLVENIEQQMEGWFKSQKLRRYAEELEVYALTMDDEITKEQLLAYIKLVHQKAEKHDPIVDIIDEIKAIVTNGLAD